MKTAIKKIITIAITAALCISFAACNNAEPESTTPDINSDSQLVNEADDGTPSKSEDEPQSEGSSPQSDATAEEEGTTPFQESETTTSQQEAPEIPEKSSETETSLVTSNEEGEPESDIPQGDKAQEIVQLAKSLEGCEYVFGGASPETGFDNSGLIYYVLTQNGINCPRMTNEIAEAGTKIGYDELQPGDLVFFQTDNSGNADFGGIYIGDGKAVMSMYEGVPVTIKDISTDYYVSVFVHGIAVGR